MELVFEVLAVWAFVFFSYRRLLRYLHMLQQDDYNNTRFLNWLVSTKSIDRYLTLVSLVPIAVWFFIDQKWIVDAVIAALFIIFGLIQVNPVKDAKKKLALTKRANRILWTAVALCAISPLTLLSPAFPWLWVAAIQAIPLLLCLANIVLKPYEKSIQNGFRTEAVNRLNEVDPTVISVTGSFGKTSVKHMVGHVIGLNANSVMTPGSVNTEMGVARVLREDLTDNTEFFMTEMGAYGIGSIERLCRFTPPDIGILTAIGAAHLERFKTLENTAIAKFELAQAVFAKPHGHMIIHEQPMEYGAKFDFVQQNRDRITIVGEGLDTDVRIASRNQTKDGLEISVIWKNETYNLVAPLYGVHHGSNMAIAFATAVVAGIDPERVVTSLRSAPQVKHRLEVKKQTNGPTYIDDAYNSNPQGFRAAVEMMALLAEGEGRRILVTPGITELGDKHDIVHAELGHFSAGLTDIAILVSPGRIPSFKQAMDAAGGVEVIEVESFSEADIWLRANAVAGDVVLLENDLPDLFNDALKI